MNLRLLFRPNAPRIAGIQYSRRLAGSFAPPAMRALTLFAAGCAVETPGADYVSRAEVDEIVAAAVEKALAENVVRVVGDDISVTVTDEATLIAAIAELDSYHIASSATYTIQVADGVYSFTAPLVFHHPDGGRIRLQGNVETPANVVFNFAGTSGIVMDEASALGFVGGLTLRGC